MRLRCRAIAGRQYARLACLFRLRLNTAGRRGYVLPALPACLRQTGGRCEHTPRFFFDDLPV